jgi:undecaprenyl diphosphate synthase
MSDTDSAQSATTASASDLPVPRHIAIIMDGNGRWAQQRGQQRTFGHEHGAQAVRPILAECQRLGVKVVTLYSFSTENWKRPQNEVDFLMALGKFHMELESQKLATHDMRFIHIGSRHGLPDAILAAFDALQEQTADRTGLTVALALNYGSRDEITDAVRAIAAKVQAGSLAPGDITQQTISDHLFTAGLPDPDLLIRTAGEMRVSNFLLWQISYTELWVTPTLWPDFTVDHLREAIGEYGRRQRRFGDVLPTPGKV